jgi:hypothetical protein
MGNREATLIYILGAQQYGKAGYAILPWDI